MRAAAPLHVLPRRQQQAVRRGVCRRAAPLLAAAGTCSWVAVGFLGSSWRGAGSSGPERASAHITARRFFGLSEPQGSPDPIPDAPKPTFKHIVKGTPVYPPWPAGMEEAMFGMGCFWCSENLFMRMEGVYSTQVGYAGGKIPNPSYNDCCSGASGHNEVVRVVFDPSAVSYAELLQVFWEKHNPTTLNQQGNDRGTQYRSGIYYYSEAQKEMAQKTKEIYGEALKDKGFRSIVTEIVPAPTFYYAEEYHQQYDARPGNRDYCGLRPTGVTLELPAAAGAAA